MIFYRDSLLANMRLLALEDDFQFLLSMRLDSFKLTTILSDDHIFHKKAGADDEVWIEVDIPGRGGQGTVYLQKRPPSFPSHLRAVTKLPKELMRSSTVDVMRELNTI